MASCTGTPVLASLCSTSSSAPRLSGARARQYLHGGLGVNHNRRLVSVEASPAALVPVAHLRVVHRHHPVLAHPVLEAHAVIAVAVATLALNVLEQQLPQQFRRRHYLDVSTVLGQLPLGQPR